MENDKGTSTSYEKRPVPSSNGSQQITVEGQKIKKGSGEMTQEIPKKFLVPEAKK